MRTRRPSTLLIAALVAAALVAPDALHAYGGPGSIISGIGALLAALAAITAAIFGFLWYPLKRLIRMFRGEGDQMDLDGAEPLDEPTGE